MAVVVSLRAETNLKIKVVFITLTTGSGLDTNGSQLATD